MVGVPAWRPTGSPRSAAYRLKRGLESRLHQATAASAGKRSAIRCWVIVGVQRSSYSDQMPRSFGITWVAKSSLLRAATSSGRFPTCMQVMSCPMRSSVTSSRTRCSTRSGDPAMI